MTNAEIKILEDTVSAGSNVARCLELTVDGDGTNIHDIKNTFDYVIKTIRNRGLTDTGFGASYVAQAEEASNTLSDLWQEISNVKKSILEFCENQRKINSMQNKKGGN